MEHMAQQVAAQHVNVVNMKDRRFFFQIDETNGLLLVFITDVSESSARFRKYLSLLNKKFVKMFKKQHFFDKNWQKNCIFSWFFVKNEQFAQIYM